MTSTIDIEQLKRELRELSTQIETAMSYLPPDDEISNAPGYVLDWSRALGTTNAQLHAALGKLRARVERMNEASAVSDLRGQPGGIIDRSMCTLASERLNSAKEIFAAGQSAYEQAKSASGSSSGQESV